MQQIGKIVFLVITLLYCSSELQAQIGLSVTNDTVLSTKDLQLDKSIIYTSTLLNLSKHENPAENIFTSKQPKIYSVDHLAFFCKIEVQLEKATKFPVKFRLGDVQYIDKLEGKTREW